MKLIWNQRSVTKSTQQINVIDMTAKDIRFTHKWNTTLYPDNPFARIHFFYNSYII